MAKRKRQTKSKVRKPRKQTKKKPTRRKPGGFFKKRKKQGAGVHTSSYIKINKGDVPGANQTGTTYVIYVHKKVRKGSLDAWRTER